MFVQLVPLAKLISRNIRNSRKTRWLYLILISDSEDTVKRQPLIESTRYNLIDSTIELGIGTDTVNAPIVFLKDYFGRELCRYLHDSTI